MTEKRPDDPILDPISVKEAAERLRLSERQLWRLIGPAHARSLRTARITTEVRQAKTVVVVSEAEVLALKAQRAGGSSEVQS